MREIVFLYWLVTTAMAIAGGYQTRAKVTLLDLALSLIGGWLLITISALIWLLVQLDKITLIEKTPEKLKCACPSKSSES